MDTDLLKTYVAFVDTGSFTRAARQTHRTQAAVSMQMRRLEEQVGRALFRREGRGLELTADGKRLVSYARRILALHDEAMAHFEPGNALPPLRIGCPDDYSQFLLPRLVATIHTTQPQLSFQLQCASSIKLRQMMDEGALDVAVVTRPPDSDEGHLLLQDRGVWLRSPSFQWDGASPLPLVLYEADCKFHSAALDGLDKQHRPYHLLATTSSGSALLAMVRDKLAVTAVATSTQSGDLVEVDDAWRLPPLPGIEIALVVGGTAHPLATTAWIKTVIEGFHAGGAAVNATPHRRGRRPDAAAATASIG